MAAVSPGLTCARPAGPPCPAGRTHNPGLSGPFDARDPFLPQLLEDKVPDVVGSRVSAVCRSLCCSLCFGGGRPGTLALEMAIDEPVTFADALTPSLLTHLLKVEGDAAEFLSRQRLPAGRQARTRSRSWPRQQRVSLQLQ